MKTPKTLGKNEKYNPDDGMTQEAENGSGFCLLILVMVVFMFIMLILSASL